jgi:NAD(P)H-quinone oxidoreductase subunit M
MATRMGNQKPEPTLKGLGQPALIPTFLKSVGALRSGTPAFPQPMADALLLKSTTRHVRLFTARVEDDQLIADPDQLTLDLDPDNEFLWEPSVLETVRQRFRDLVAGFAGQDLTEYNLRRIGSDLEGTIRQLLQAGELRYNPDARVLNYSMGLPRSPDA